MAIEGQDAGVWMVWRGREGSMKEKGKGSKRFCVPEKKRVWASKQTSKETPKLFPNTHKEACAHSHPKCVRTHTHRHTHTPFLSFLSQCWCASHSPGQKSCNINGLLNLSYWGSLPSHLLAESKNWVKLTRLYPSSSNDSKKLKQWCLRLFFHPFICGVHPFIMSKNSCTQYYTSNCIGLWPGMLFAYANEYPQKSAHLVLVFQAWVER